MKVSELIKELQKNIKKYGDHDIKIHNPYGESIDDDFENINICHVDFDDGSDGCGEIEEHFVIEGF